MAKRKCWICDNHPAEADFGLCKSCSMVAALTATMEKYHSVAARVLAGMATYAEYPGTHKEKAAAANAKLEECRTKPPDQVRI